MNRKSAKRKTVGTPRKAFLAERAGEEKTTAKEKTCKVNQYKIGYTANMANKKENIQEQIIYSQQCWIDGQFQEANIFIADGKIQKIQKGPKVSGNIFDAKDSIVMPGAIDAHVHINEPGRTEWEGFATATKAAAMGGITTLVDMPLNSSPVTTTVASFEDKINATKGKLYVNCGFYGGLVPDNCDNILPLIEKGVLGIKAFLIHSGIDEFPEVGKKEILAAAAAIKAYNIPLLAHCELEISPTNSDYSTNYQQYLASRPKAWENEAVQMLIDVCNEQQLKTHVVHVSSADALDLIQKAKNNGANLTAETCPHYLYFDAENISDGQTIFKCAPPIREKTNNEQLKAALKSGTLDFIATDHSPAPADLKELESGNFKKAWGGISGLQFLLSASWTALRNQLSLEEFVPLLTSSPAKFLGIDQQKGFIKEGYDADLIVWKPTKSFIVSEQLIQHRHKHSPYKGQELFGLVTDTFVNGVPILQNQLLQNNIAGKCIFR